MTSYLGRLRPPALAAAPSSPATGELYYDTGSNTLFYWNGVAWVSGGSGGGGGGVTVYEQAGTPTEPTDAGDLWIDTDEVPLTWQNLGTEDQFWRMAGGVAVWESGIHTADLDDQAVTAAKIADGTILNAEISASAAITPNKLALGPLQAAATADVTFTTGDSNATGAAVTLPVVGTYLVIGCFDIFFSANTGGDTASLRLNLNGVNQALEGKLKDANTATGPRNMATQIWVVTTTGANWVAQLRVVRAGTTGTATVKGGAGAATTITALRVA